MGFYHIPTMSFIILILVALLVNSQTEATSCHAPNVLAIKPNEPDSDGPFKTIAFSLIDPIGPDPNGPSSPPKMDCTYSKLSTTVIEIVKQNKQDLEKPNDPTVEMGMLIYY